MSAAERRAEKRDIKVEFLPPLKPRRALFWILLIAFLAWLAFLIGLYMTTVHHRASAT